MDTLFPATTLFRSDAGQHQRRFAVRSRHQQRGGGRCAEGIDRRPTLYRFGLALQKIKQLIAAQRIQRGGIGAARKTGGEGHGKIRGKWSGVWRSEEHTSELQSLMRISYAVFCLKKKINTQQHTTLHFQIAV